MNQTLKNIKSLCIRNKHCKNNYLNNACDTELHLFYAFKNR